MMDTNPARGTEKEEPKASDKSEPREQTSVTSGTVTIAGQLIPYTATAGTLILKKDNPKEEPRASFFYVAYTRDQVPHRDTRPIVFAFNGGPGASSAWLHIGMLGPYRIQFGEPGHPAVPPYRLIENGASLLDIADLVFVDPISTGFSRPAEGVDPRQFHGVQEDVSAVAEFIRLYTTRQSRWNSPKILLGESYGTTRAALLAPYLQEQMGLYVSGVVLISSVLDFQTLDDSGNSDLSYILYLPTYAATAWYHHRLDPALRTQPLAQVVAEAERFALGPYAAALMRGNLAPAERTAIAQQVARLTGLAPDYVERANLRISQSRFTKELLRDGRRTIGRFDSRYTGIDRDAAGEAPEFDPSYAALLGPFTGAINDYVRSRLCFATDRPYEVLTGKVQPWNFSQYENRYLNAADSLRRAMSFNPALKLFVACGYYDLATPLLASRYTLDHMALEPALADNVTVGYYEGGHMMYIDQGALARLREDLARFVDKATQPPPAPAATPRPPVRSTI